jgi:uncharacterized protein (DUF697 family)
MATLSVNAITSAGVVEAALVAAAVGGDQVQNNGRTFLKITNGSGGAITVTVASQVTCSQGSTHNATNAVAAGATDLMGPFDTTRFNDANGYIQITYSGVTSLTIGAFSV